nr:MAG TPA: TraM-like-terminal domain of transfer protein TraM [Caudoviricetes sp.]
MVFFRYFLTTYTIPFLSADVLKKYDKKRLFVVSLFLFSF